MTSYKIPSESPTAVQRRDDEHPLLWPVSVGSLTISLMSYTCDGIGVLSTVVMWGTGAIGLFGLWMVYSELWHNVSQIDP